MPDFPSLSQPPEPPRTLLKVTLAAMAIGLLAGGGYWLTHRGSTGASGASEAPTPPPAAPPVVAASPLTPAPTAPPEPLPLEAKGVHAFTVSVQGPLETAITQAAGKQEGTPLTQVVTRSLVWWLRVPQDLARGDTLSVVYETREGQEPLVLAVKLKSLKQDKTFEAFRYQPPGAPFARYFQADGSELEERLVDGPLDSYEQITSLLKDGRHHRGIDFKTPVGTPVKATFDGVVTRRTWNFRSNGNSLEIQESGGQGRKAMFLHLSEIDPGMRPGRSVKKGEVVAKSGNTGHSFAPHLHYQLMKDETVIDPLSSHKTMRHAIPPEERGGLDREATRLRALFPAT